MKHSFWQGVAATVIGGVLVWALTSFAGYSLDPRPKLEWSTHNDVVVPIEPPTPFFSVFIRNAGGASAKNISFIFEDAPTKIDFNDVTRSELGIDSGFSRLTIPAIAANGSADFVVFGLHSSQIIEVLLDGNPIAPVELAPVEKLDKMPYGTFGFFFGIFTMIVIFRQEVARARRMGELDALRKTSTKQLNEVRERTDELLVQVQTEAERLETKAVPDHKSQ